jgi:hypothetical protein
MTNKPHYHHYVRMGERVGAAAARARESECYSFRTNGQWIKRGQSRHSGIALLLPTGTNTQTTQTQED